MLSIDFRCIKIEAGVGLVAAASLIVGVLILSVTAGILVDWLYDCSCFMRTKLESGVAEPLADRRTSSWLDAQCTITSGEPWLQSQVEDTRLESDKLYPIIPLRTRGYNWASLGDYTSISFVYYSSITARLHSSRKGIDWERGLCSVKSCEMGIWIAYARSQWL